MRKPERKLDFYDHDDLVRAVIVVFDRFTSEGKEPGADSWIVDTRHARPQMIRDVIDEWRDICEATDGEIFPFHDDYVCRLWSAYRRNGEKNKEAIRSDYFLRAASSMS
jgi:hypothetical protein